MLTRYMGLFQYDSGVPFLIELLQGALLRFYSKNCSYSRIESYYAWICIVMKFHKKKKLSGTYSKKCLKSKKVPGHLFPMLRVKQIFYVGK